MNRKQIPWRLFYSTFKEALPLTLIAFVILTMLVFVQQVGKYSSIILSFQATSQVTMKFLMSLLPGIVIITLPVSLLLGTVIACSRLATDGELTAAQSLGISKLHLALPFIFTGLLGTLVTFYLSAEVAPRSLKELKSLRARILLQEANNVIRPRMFVTTFPNVLLHVQDIDAKTGEWVGVFILQQEPGKGVSRLLTAERGQLRITPSPQMALEAQLYSGLSLENRSVDKSGKPGTGIFEEAGVTDRAVSDFQKLSIKLTEKAAQDEDERGDAPAGMTEMTISEVARSAAKAPDNKDRIKAMVEWHKRIAFPFACLTLTCLTFIMALRGRRFTTRPRTVIAILFIAMGFYLVLVSGQNIALSGKVPPWLGVWLSNILLGLYIVKSFSTNRSLTSLPVISTITAILSEAGDRIADAWRWLVKSLTVKDENTRATSTVRFSIINLINYLIVSEVAKFYLLALLALVVTTVIFTLFDLIPAMARTGTSIAYAASYLAYLSPQLAYHVTPFAFLVAILMGCSVLTRTNQLVIIYGAGQSKYRLLGVISLTALLLSGALWLLSDVMLPHTNREQDIRYSRIKSRQLEQTTIAFGRKWVFGRNNNIYSYQRIEPDNTLINTSMYHLSPSRWVLEESSFFARAAQISENSWQASGGWTDTIRPDLTINRVPINAGQNNVMITDGAGLFKRTINESSKMSTGELADYIEQLGAIGIPTTDLKIDLSKRLAFPFSCLTLALIALPFATGKRAMRSGPLLSVAIGVGLSLIFWLLMTLFEAAGKQSSLSVGLSVWGPQVMFVALGLYLNFKLKN